MNHKLIRAHWVMLDCLANEVARDFPLEWHAGTMIEQLFSYYAGRDIRFRARGFFWSQPDGCFVYWPDGLSSCKPGAEWPIKGFIHEHNLYAPNVYVGDAAIAAFLGLEVVGKGLKMLPSADAQRVIYKEFPSAIEAINWISWETSKLFGYTVRKQDFLKGLPRRWPVIKDDEALPAWKGVIVGPTILEQMAGKSTISTRIPTAEELSSTGYQQRD